MFGKQIECEILISLYTFMPKKTSKRDVLKFYLGPNNDIEFLKNFMYIILKN